MVRTRFAPSPTGFLHIGGVRTALFNWLFTRKAGGAFILRIDDTDRSRNLEDALEPILHGFRWLGLDWDEGPGVGGDRGPYFQSERGPVYAAAVERLLAAGAAYRDYATPEEIAAERRAAEQGKARFVYSRRFAALTDGDRERFEAEGRSAVVRLKMPRTGACRFNDEVRGEVEFAWEGEQDHVVQRADGSVLYHLASAVDDHEMGITHVIRAEEHLSNTPRQIWITESLGWEPPRYAHLPYVAEPGSKAKLSKRKLAKYLKQPDFAALARRGEAIAEKIGLETSPESFNPVVVAFYEVVGFLPDALLDYLMLLGWSLDDSSERFTPADRITNFSLARVQKAPASFDPKKLAAFQARSMAALDLDAKVDMALPFLKRAGLVGAGEGAARRGYVEAIVRAAGDRIEIAGDILDYEEFFLADEDLVYDEKAFEKRLVKPPRAAELLGRARGVLATTEPFGEAEVETAIRTFVDAEGIKLGDIVHALRVATTGKAIGFGLFEALAVLGRERSLARIDQALARLAARVPS